MTNAGTPVALPEVVPPKGKKQNGPFERFAHRATHAAGSTHAFIVAISVVVVWAATGPVFHFSDTWQLVINTGTTVVTFLMVFLIQHTQNKDSAAIQLKLDEIVAAIPEASNHLIDAEDLDMDELERLHKLHQDLANEAAEHVRGRRRANDKADAETEDAPKPPQRGSRRAKPRLGTRRAERSTRGRGPRRR